MKVTKICCDICKAEIPKQLYTEVDFKYLINDKLEVFDLCPDCRRKVVDFMQLLEEVSETNELSSY